MSGNAHILAEISYTQTEEILRQTNKKVALIPSGSTEAHGPHLPLATDSIISEAAAIRSAHELAKRGYEAVVFPTLHYAVTDWAGSFKGSTSISVATASALLLETCLAAKNMGFDGVVLVNAHLEPDNIQTLRAVTKAYREQAQEDLIFPDVTRRKVAEQLTEEFQSGSCHAGQYETSIVMAVHPNLVKDDVAKTLPEHFIPLHERIQAGAKDFVECGLDQAYCGAPAKATAEEGEQTLQTLARITGDWVDAFFEAQSNP